MAFSYQPHAWFQLDDWELSSKRLLRSMYQVMLGGVHWSACEDIYFSDRCKLFWRSKGTFAWTWAWSKWAGFLFRLVESAGWGCEGWVDSPLRTLLLTAFSRFLVDKITWHVSVYGKLKQNKLFDNSICKIFIYKPLQVSTFPQEIMSEK